MTYPTTPPTYRAVVALLAHLQRAHGYALWQEVAEHLGVREQYLSQVRLGRTGVSLERLWSWCALEGITLAVHPDASIDLVAPTGETLVRVEPEGDSDG